MKISFLLTYVIHTRWCAQPCRQNEYVTDVDGTTCESCGTGDTSTTQIECPLGKQRVDFSLSNLCHFCCATCRLCDVCGLGIFLYHDFEGRACSRNSNVVCCEEENMDVHNDHCVHRTTTTNIIKMTTALAITKRPVKMSIHSASPKEDISQAHSPGGARRTRYSNDNYVIIVSFFCGELHRFLFGRMSSSFLEMRSLRAFLNES